MTRTLRRGVVSWKPVKNLFFSLMSSLLLLVLFLEKCAEFVAKYCGVIRQSRSNWFSGQRITRQRAVGLPSSDQRAASKKEKLSKFTVKGRIYCDSE